MELSLVIALFGLLVVCVAASTWFFRMPASRASESGGVSAAVQEKLLRTEERLKQAQAQLDEQKTKTDALQRELTVARERAAGLEAEKRTLDERYAKMEKEAGTRFENLANKILESQNKKFSEHSQKSLSELLNPLKNQMVDFNQLVAKSFGEQTQQHKSLKEEIHSIVMTAENLTTALRGDTRVQGNWGEVILERILEEAGLQKGRDYILQGEGLKLKETETGRHQKPDVIVKLPDDKHVIIDSKVSLTHYEKLCAEADEAESVKLRRQFIQSVKNHVNGLEARRYQDTDKLGSPDVVFMFIPIEAAYSLAMQCEPELHSYAWGKRVAIVCPTTLFASMNVVESLWKIEKQNRNTQEMARLGGALYDKIAGFVDDMQKFDKQLGTLRGTYESALTKMQGHGNMLSYAERMRKLGASSSKQLPAELLEDEVEEEKPEVLEAVS